MDEPSVGHTGTLTGPFPWWTHPRAVAIVAKGIVWGEFNKNPFENGISFCQGAGSLISQPGPPVNILNPFPGGVQKTSSFPLRALSFDRICSVLSPQGPDPCLPLTLVISCLLTIIPTSGLFPKQSLTFRPLLPIPEAQPLPGQTTLHPSKPISSKKPSLTSWADRIDSLVHIPTAP